MSRQLPASSSDQAVLDRVAAQSAIKKMLHTDPGAIDDIVAWVGNEERRTMEADAMTIKGHIAALAKVRHDIQPTAERISANAALEVQAIKDLFTPYYRLIQEREELLMREVQAIKDDKLAAVREQTARIDYRIEEMEPGLNIAERALECNAFGKNHDAKLRAEATMYLKKATVPFNTAVEVVADIRFEPTNVEPLEGMIAAIGKVTAGVVGVVNIVSCVAGFGDVTIAWQPFDVVSSDTRGGEVCGYELEMSVPPSSGMVPSVVGNDTGALTRDRSKAAAVVAAHELAVQRWRRIYRGAETRYTVPGAPGDACFRVRAYSKSGFSAWSTETPLATEAKELEYDCEKKLPHGVLYWLGTKGNPLGGAWRNPHVTGAVTAHASSVQWGAYDLSQLTGQSTSVFSTKSEPHSWAMVDLGANYRLSPTHYTIFARSDIDYNMLRRWSAEGSVNGEDWFLLRKHNFDCALREAGGSATWELMNTGMSFRYLRIVQTGANSHGNYHLIISHFEWYGTLN